MTAPYRREAEPDDDDLKILTMARILAVCRTSSGIWVQHLDGKRWSVGRTDGCSGELILRKIDPRPETVHDAVLVAYEAWAETDRQEHDRVVAQAIEVGVLDEVPPWRGAHPSAWPRATLLELYTCAFEEGGSVILKAATGLKGLYVDLRTDVHAEGVSVAEEDLSTCVARFRESVLEAYAEAQQIKVDMATAAAVQRGLLPPPEPAAPAQPVDRWALMERSRLRLAILIACAVLLFWVFGHPS